MSELYSLAEKGVRSLAIEESIRAATLANLRQWLEKDDFAAYRPQMEDLIRRGQWNLLVDSFYQVLPFGTGGRRGPVGIGPNRFNAYTLSSSVQGHAEYLKAQKEKKGWAGELSVVVAYDTRQFNDGGGNYRKNVLNPCLEMSSKDFARIASGVYAANGIQVWMLSEAETSVMSTPELSFLIRHLKARGGLNVSASHNPPDDNGAKIYNYAGGQEVPPNDEEMVRLVEQVEAVKQMDYEEAKRRDLIRFIPDRARRAYIDAIKAVSLQPQFRGATIVFSPLHGAGKGSAGRVLEESGFKVIRVEEQWADDSNFSRVPNQIANPEEPPAMVMAGKLAKQVGADLALATDPDADRIGAVAPDRNGRWYFLDGNQIGTLLAHYVLETRRQLKKLPNHPLIIKTEVTTGILERMARAAGARIVGHLLVGFKYIGDVLRQIEETGAFEGEPYTLDDFLLGTEESHGFLVTPAIRDKDSAGACLLLAEFTAVCKHQGRTVMDILEDIYRKFGFTRNLLVSVAMSDAEGKDRLQRILRSLRSDPPSRIGELAVQETLDLQDERGRFGKIQSETDRSSRNVLIFRMEDGSKAVIRPSGTEPKTKIYFEGTGKLEGSESFDSLRTRIDASLQALADQFTQEMLSRGAVKANAPGVRVSGLDSLAKKQNFEAFMSKT
jgi:phosphoglucomutase/phosphomannomutase